MSQTPGGCPAGHPADPQKSTLVRSASAGIQRRVPSFFRGTTGLSRAIAAGLAAGTALLALTGCMMATSKADVADVIVIAATATANESAPALSSANVALLQATGESSTSAVAFVVNPANGQPAQLPLTPRRSDGQVEYGPRRPQLLAQNVSRVESQISNEAATGPFDLLNTMLDASRVTSPPATMLLLTSGVTTSGGFDLRQVGWAEPPVSAAAALKQRGLLPDLAGWTVIFSGLGETAGRQPALPLPQQTTLASYWLAICHAAGAAACRVDDSPRPVRSSYSTVPVPIVPVPAVQSIIGPQASSSRWSRRTFYSRSTAPPCFRTLTSTWPRLPPGPAPGATQYPSPGRRLLTAGPPPTISGSQRCGPGRYNAALSR